MSPKPTPSISSIVESIAAVLGLMTGVFTLLSSILPTSIVQPIGTIILGIILTYILICIDRLTWYAASLAWTGASILLIIIYLAVSQPVTLSGYVVKSDGTPLAGETLIIRNSNHIDQEAVTDKNGRFEVRGVPEGKYTVTVNGTPVYGGEILSGWQRGFSLTIDLGTFAVPVASRPTPMPTAISLLPTPSPSPTTTFTESDTPTVPLTMVATYTATATPQYSAYNQIQTSVATTLTALVPAATATPLPTDTPTPEPIVAPAWPANISFITRSSSGSDLGGGTSRVYNASFIIHSSSGSDLGDGMLNVYTANSVQYAETTRIELELHFNNLSSG